MSISYGILFIAYHFSEAAERCFNFYCGSMLQLPVPCCRFILDFSMQFLCIANQYLCLVVYNIKIYTKSFYYYYYYYWWSVPKVAVCVLATFLWNVPEEALRSPRCFCSELIVVAVAVVVVVVVVVIVVGINPQWSIRSTRQAPHRPIPRIDKCDNLPQL